MEFIGIDFGMKNLKAAYYSGTGSPRCINLSGKQHSDLTPNIVYYKENENFELKKYFGSSPEVVKALRLEDNTDCIRFIKREICRSGWTKTICGGKYTVTAEDVVSDIFGYIAERVKNEIRKINIPVVLTVPVLFSEIQKNLLCKCAKRAGFSEIEVITEPFAALFSPDIIDNIKEDNTQKYIIVFDFGCSTLDICLFDISGENQNSEIKLLASSGMNFGGHDITRMIADAIHNRAKAGIEQLRQANASPKHIDDVLFDAAEELKIQIYDEIDTEDAQTAVSGTVINLTRDETDNIILSSGIKQKIYKLLDDMFEDIDEGVEPDEISAVYTVGGTSKISLFSDLLIEYFGVDIDIDYLEDNNYIYNSVCIGAANYPVLRQTINIKNAVPMNVYIDRGKGLEIALRKNMFYSENGRAVSLNKNELEINGWTIPVYQTLKSNKKLSKEDDGVFYAGVFRLTPKEYQKTGKIYMKLSYDNKGLCANTFCADEDDMKDTEKVYIERR